MGYDPENFLPRCYDFTIEKQIDLFTQDFQRTAIFNLVKKHAKFYKKAHSKELQEITEEFEKYKSWNNKNPWIERLKNYYKSVYLPFTSSSKGQFLTNSTLLTAAISFVRYQIKNRMGDLNEKVSENWTNLTKQFRNLAESLAILSTFSVPYTNSTIQSFSV